MLEVLNGFFFSSAYPFLWLWLLMDPHWILAKLDQFYCLSSVLQLFERRHLLTPDRLRRPVSYLNSTKILTFFFFFPSYFCQSSLIYKPVQLTLYGEPTIWVRLYFTETKYSPGNNGVYLAMSRQNAIYKHHDFQFL